MRNTRHDHSSNPGQSSRRPHGHGPRRPFHEHPRREQPFRHGNVNSRQPGFGAGYSQEDETHRKFKLSVAIDPSPRLRLEDGSPEMTMRAMDLICPIGMGQRGLIVAPPGSGKTTFLKHLCQSVSKSHPEMKIYCLLIDERPEEVTDFRRSVTAEVRWSSSDESYEHHIETADKLMKQVYGEVLGGANVMILVDSLTRLARVHNAEGRSSGRTLSGGVDARALEVPRRIFGSARKIEHGGSLTILATILVDTGSRMDQIIFEEFKGTGNMEVYLSREISNQRIYPAIDIPRSGTRKEELLLDATELEPVRRMRRALAGLPFVDAIKALLTQLHKYPTNKAFLAAVAKEMKS
ncbi:MAG TPA: transcription termination factor Rho [Candidatus Omnitrophota bacterium]|nr:transcription termination factor Rho [Candidatus Omnitrophota bacterium]HPS37240.1 transcription termination factor Rho [Candidatus Omnitrophota bacterium]